MKLDQLICDVQFGHLDDRTIMQTIRLLGADVMPELERRRVALRASVTAS